MLLFQSPVMEIKSRKIKSGFLMFARLVVKKGSADDYLAIEKQREKESRASRYSPQKALDSAIMDETLNLCIVLIICPQI